MGADLGELMMRELKVLGYGTGLRAGMTGQSPKSPQLWGWGPGKGAGEGPQEELGVVQGAEWVGRPEGSGLRPGRVRAGVV